jgi:hypothetical protein
MASTLGKVSLFVYIQKALIVLSVLRENKYFVKTFGQKFVEILLSILGKRKISVMNLNLEEFRQGLNWA